MAFLVSDVYNAVCVVLLEDLGLTTGIVTQQQFLSIFPGVLLDFLKRGKLNQKIFTQSIQFAISQYVIPNDLLSVDEAFVAGYHIDRTNLGTLDDNEYAWPNKLDFPNSWHEDGLPPKTIELFPAPNYEGVDYTGSQPPFGKYGDFFPTDNNLTTVGTAGLLVNAFVLGDTVPLIPDSFMHYLGYGVLEKIFNSDAETKDAQRAFYCGARFIEGISLAQAITGFGESEW